MDYIQIGRFSFNVELLKDKKLTDSYDNFPNINKETVKLAWEKVNPKKDKKK